MPLNDKNNASQPAKPLMPTLAQKRNVKSPITPRLAAGNSNAGVATPPLAKSSVRSATPNVKSPAASREDLSTPAKAFISSNVTPRSGSRKSRVDSNNTTPVGTPNGSRAASHVDGGIGSGGKPAPFAGFGLGIASQVNKSRPNSVVGGFGGAIAPGVTSTPKFFGGARLDDQGDGPMFFRADDGPQRSPELRPAIRKSPTFLYANGQQDESIRPTSQPSPPLSSVSTKSKKSQFFRADGRADDDIPPVPSLPLPSPTAMNAPPQFFQAAPAFRPPSPGKDPTNFHLSYRKGASQIIRPPAKEVERPKTISILPPNGVEQRKRSLGGASATTSAPHKRTSSLSSIESGASARKPSSAGVESTGLTPLHTIMQASSPALSEASSAPPLAQSPSPIAEQDSFVDSVSSLPSQRDRQVSPSSPILSFPQSPTKQGSLQSQLAETIMNARVERKIQDLEISNSSLMAINKSLEKEVRRQNRELRRFRRLSRAGRLSTASTMLSVGTNGDDDFDGELSALDELTEESEPEEEEEEEESSSSSGDDASLSPEAIAEREERKLAKDSKRLQLDLAKHRDILVDSQKLNQSLKRCMAWTEMMIKDGRKALDYKAEHDVGGRILDHDEMHADDEEEGEDEEEARHSLLSSWTPSPNPMPHLEALDGLLGLDTSAITNGSTSSSSAMPAAMEKGDFWSIAGALE